MVTLTETAYYTRKGSKWIIAGLIGFMILRGLVLFSIDYYKKTHPKAPPPPTEDFGKLPGLSFVTLAPSNQFTYKLQIIEGVLPTFPDRATVYFMPKEVPNLLAKERAKVFAKNLGFDSQPAEANYVLTFIDSLQSKTLKLDTINKNFTFHVDLGKDSSILGKSPIRLEEAKKAITDLFSQTDNFPFDSINEEKTKITYVATESGKLVETDSAASAVGVRYDFFKKAINDVPIVSSSFYDGNMHATYTGMWGEKKYFADAELFNFPVNLESKGTYPIKTSEQALDELQNGKGFVVATGAATSETIIRRVYIGYYDSKAYQQYLQPVVVFEGDQGFAAYVPAVSSSSAEFSSGVNQGEPNGSL